jgi:hypothetical protein
MQVWDAICSRGMMWVEVFHVRFEWAIVFWQMFKGTGKS